MAAVSAFQEVKIDLAHELMRIGAFLTADADHELVATRGNERGFWLKEHEHNPEAPLSPFYLNLRTPKNPKPGPLTSAIVDLAARCMRGVQLDNQLTFGAVAGIPNAGDPFARAFARLTGMKPLDFEKYTDDKRRRISSIKEPDRARGHTVLLIDDLITNAGSKIEAIEVLERCNAFVKAVLVLVDREQGGVVELRGYGVNTHAVFSISELLDLYRATGSLSEVMYDRIRTYLGKK